MGYREIHLPDGRTLEVLEEGEPGGFPWLYHSGSPSAAVPYPAFDEAAERAGLRLITYSRPGYGSSTARRPEQGPPRYADDVADSVAILDQLGVDDFITLGWSGGGPRALGCAALLPDRCRAATSLAGVGPMSGLGEAWFDDMAPENRAEYTAASQGPDAYAAYLQTEFLPILQASPDELAAAMGQLLTPVDLAAWDEREAAYISESFQRAGAQGVVGMRDDGLAGMADWGFDLGSIVVPTAIWQGDQDAMVPFGHGQWLATHVAGARAHLLPDEGHVSIAAHIDEMLAELKEMAGV